MEAEAHAGLGTPDLGNIIFSFLFAKGFDADVVDDYNIFLFSPKHVLDIKLGISS